MQNNTSTYRLLILVILMGLASGPLSAQTPFDADLMDEAAQIREQVFLFADRSIYAVDETIYFVADHRVSGPIGELPWSSVLYVELITSNGEALAQGKYGLSGGRAEGSLHIPVGAVTGDYFLKSYTRWMRNQGPGSFSYTPLKIINPYRSEVAVQNDTDRTPDAVQKLAYKEGLLECSMGSETLLGSSSTVCTLGIVARRRRLPFSSPVISTKPCLTASASRWSLKNAPPRFSMSENASRAGASREPM